MAAAFDLHITGVVQGVGFRPFVFRLAHRFNLSGWVANSTDGVHAHIEGRQSDCLAFMQAVELEAPAAAMVQSVTARAAPRQDYAEFSIRQSSGLSTLVSTFISPDLATCPDCLRELNDVGNRRYRYPFINCTNCGPRFTIIEGLPYDRHLTTMAGFAMCEDCSREYHDPTDRRFHAQPDACFACGPKLSLFAHGQTVYGRDPDQVMSILAEVRAALNDSAIIAIKGLGGYHLACDATNQAAVLKLRQRKRRSNKPLAVMLRDLQQAAEYCESGSEEADLLSGSLRPIVLLKRRQVGGDKGESNGYAAGGELGQRLVSLTRLTPPTSMAPLADAVAGGLSEVGVMLPYTPLQHLLLTELDYPLVMTSGNLSEEPIIGDVDEAHRLLADIADLFLDNDRPIASRYDDSVVRVISGRTHMVRRARGYAPLPLRLPLPAPTEILAAGAEQKNTFCLVKGNMAYVSQHLGDLDDAHALANWDHTRQLYQRLFDITPTALSADLHPDYLSTKWAVAHSGSANLPLDYVQHHHAHIASVIAENTVQPLTGSQVSERRVIGFAFDGSGLGEDRTIWGGEVLVADLCSFDRVAHLKTAALPGGSAAIQEPWRMAYSWLYQCNLLDHPGALPLLYHIGSERAGLLNALIERRLNSPETSSMGRLFDAVSALLGICLQAGYDGEPAVLLEATMMPRSGETWVAPQKDPAYGFVFDGTVIDPTAVLRAVLDDLAAGVSVPLIAGRFHRAVVEMVVDVAAQVSGRTGLDEVALSGGVFMNRYLCEQLGQALQSAGFEVLFNRQLPANDGCIAYGQACVTAARQSLASGEGFSVGEH